MDWRCLLVITLIGNVNGMASPILESVISITSQRDTNDLDFSTIATIAELITITSASIIRRYQTNGTSVVQVHLQIDINDPSPYQWNEHSPHIDHNMHDLCIDKDTYIQNDVDGVTQLYFPIDCNDLYDTVLRITTTENISSQFDLLNGLLRVYRNYYRLLEESERDKLTGLLNRNSLERRITKLANEPVDSTETVLNHDTSWLAVIDIDFFKRVNDTYGHVCGDEILLIVAQKMQSYFADKNLLFRFGGEEFIVVIKNMAQVQAHAVFDNFRLLVEQQVFPFDEHITVSIGFSEFANVDYPTCIIDQADKALYYAKENGRNCVHDYGDLVKQGLIPESAIEGDIELF